MGKIVNAQLKIGLIDIILIYLKQINKTFNFFNFELVKKMNVNDYVHITNYNIYFNLNDIHGFIFSTHFNIK